MRSEAKSQARHARIDSAPPADKGRDHAHAATRNSFISHYLSIIHHQSSIINPDGFTLIELLVVIAIIAVLLAIFIPVTRAARERGQRAVCLSNLHQLTMAWIAYADDHDGKLVLGEAMVEIAMGPRIGFHTKTMKGWLGRAFHFPESRSAIIADPNKGALWPYLRDIDIYRCPRAPIGHASTYKIVSGANGANVEGTYRIESTINGPEPVSFGKRVGDTVLRLTRLMDITSPGAAARAVFIDEGATSGPGDFRVYYLRPEWCNTSPPPIHHADGVTLSMADGHGEYWKWKGRETVAGLPRKLVPTPAPGILVNMLAGGDYAPRTQDGLYDLQRVQKATWGRLGYPPEETP